MIFFTSSDIYNKFTLCLAIRNRKIFLSSYPKTLKPKLFLVFKFTNVFYVYEVLDFQKCLTHIHIHDILKFWSNDFRAVLDKTTLGWTTENISCHCFEYWDIHLLLWILLVMVNNQKLSLDRISPALKHETKHSDKTLRNFIKSWTQNTQNIKLTIKTARSVCEIYLKAQKLENICYHCLVK